MDLDNTENNDIIDMLSSEDSDSEDEFTETETKIDEDTLNDDIDSDENMSEEDNDDDNETISGILDTKKQTVFTNNLENYKLNKIKKKQSLPYLTKFEKSLILGIRLKQLISNGKPAVNTDDCKNIRDILIKNL